MAILSPASPSENLLALADVDNFELTSEDSYGNRHTYRILDDATIAVELERLSHLKVVGASTSMTFQPLAASENQDRTLTLEWAISGREWVFDCILDGNITLACIYK